MFFTDPFEIKNRKIVITGAASGIGRKTAEILLQGANEVYVIDRKSKELLNLSEEYSGSAIFPIIADISLESDRKRIIDSMPDCIEGLVNCAGIIKLKPMRYVNEKDIHDITMNNYEGPVLLTNYLIKKNKLVKGASVIFLSSVMSHISTETNGIYTGTKAAIAGIVKTYALELASQQIRVNAILPAFVETPMLSEIGNLIDLEKNRSDHPLGFGNASDIAYSILFLLSDASKWITGTNLIIDGGFYAK